MIKAARGEVDISKWLEENLSNYPNLAAIGYTTIYSSIETYFRNRPISEELIADFMCLMSHAPTIHAPGNAYFITTVLLAVMLIVALFA